MKWRLFLIGVLGFDDFCSIGITPLATTTPEQDLLIGLRLLLPSLIADLLLSLGRPLEATADDTIIVFIQL
jgi:hypothetical protein